MHVGLVVPDKVLSPTALTVVALLPRYLEARHEQCTDDQHAINRHLLLWKALRFVLADFLALDTAEESIDSYLPLGKVRLGSAGREQDAYAVPLLWLGGACPCQTLPCACVQRCLCQVRV